MGVSVKWKDGDLVIKPPAKFNLSRAEYYSAPRTRGNVMLIGPLIHYFKDFKVNQPDGCKLGSRTVQAIFLCA
jgi:UDP-N-acetylglucosamine 1-carboxyvinyltransferase